MSEILYVVIPPTRIPSFSQRKKPLYQVHSGFFHILCFFWTISSNRRSLLRWGSALPLVRSPRRPAAPCKFGEAHAARQRLAGPAAPSSGPLTPAKPTLPGSAPQARQRLAKSRAYIGRLGMRTVKVVPSPGMLST